LELAHYEGAQLIEQLLDEQLLILQHNDFHFVVAPCSGNFKINVHLFSIRRVFDNVFSNIIKYANPARPVKITYDIVGQDLSIEIENCIGAEPYDVHSTGIGIKTCQRILHKHKGNMTITCNAEIYAVRIRLPATVD
jgi:light-regulated signal transduction histidine kinase (bacteriophytochrome)